MPHGNFEEAILYISCPDGSVLRFQGVKYFVDERMLRQQNEMPPCAVAAPHQQGGVAEILGFHDVSALYAHAVNQSARVVS